jgi:uncharacterized membrane protein YphA (DoxX/SURF4 family)
MRVDNVSFWFEEKKFLFRILFVYVLLNIIPLDKMFYEYLSTIKIGELNCRDLFIISTYRHFSLIKNVDHESFKWGVLGYINLVLPFGVAAVIAFIWKKIQPQVPSVKLYYWMEVALRYRVGLGMIAWGFRKLLPSQMVLPTYTILNTPYGDIQAQKHYWQSVGIVPGYEVFLGFAEFIPGILLLHKRTAVLGAALAFVVMINVTLANHAYDGSVHIHSFSYAIWSFITLIPYLGSIIKVIVSNSSEKLNIYRPILTPSFNRVRLAIKSFIVIVFVFLFFGLQVKDYIETPYRLPKTPGVFELNGYYDVEKFVWNGEERSYNPLDSLRWQEAIFEKWRTLSFKINQKSPIDQSNGGGYTTDDRQRKWEVAGIGGGRKWFHYDVDESKRILYLYNKNDFFCLDKNSHHFKQQYSKTSSAFLDSAICEERITLNYQISDDKVILSGYNNNGDKIYIQLRNIHRSYPLLAKK